MKLPDKCCGNCKWAAPRKAKKYAGKSVVCTAPIPESVCVCDHQLPGVMRMDEGTDCPCHEPKETNDGEA